MPDKPDVSLVEEKHGYSVEDEQFLRIIKDGLIINENGNVQMPLPFKSLVPVLPDNRTVVKRWVENTLSRLQRDYQTLSGSII